MHIVYSPIIHHSGLFLTWHRFYTWLYEKALRDECGYKGGQPYWDWTLNWDDLTKSPVFDGSAYSMGSNGKSIPHGPVNDTALGSTRLLNPGTGGGCVESGPFANLTINLGPFALLPEGPNHGLGYNPRCLHRDFSAEWNNNTKPTDIVDVIRGFTDVVSFDKQFEALKGPHAGGHFGVGGMMADQYASPSDPVFWLHHGMIDRVWTMWQSRDPKARTTQTGRTVTAQNSKAPHLPAQCPCFRKTYANASPATVPPSANATLDTMMPFGMLSTSQRLGDLVSTIDGPFCYQYQ
jgi:tyrosinase